MYQILIYIICLAFGGLIGFAIKCCFDTACTEEEINKLEKRLETWEKETTTKKKPKSKFKEDSIEDFEE